jgi:hypothetical protein
MLSPVNGSIVKTIPVEFKWGTVMGALTYRLEISKTNTFSTLVFPINDDNANSTETTMIPDIDWEDGIYYYRICSQDSVDRGEWSPIYQINIDTLTEGNISEEDIPAVDVPLYDDAPIELELIESFPKELDYLVPTNVQNLYFRFIGDVDTSLLDKDSFKLVGTHISGDSYEQSHGVVSGKTTFVKSDDGTSYMIFTPIPLTTTAGGS